MNQPFIMNPNNNNQPTIYKVLKMKTQKTVTLNKELFDIMLDNISRAEELMYKEMDNLESKYNINYMDNDLLIVRCQISNTKEMLESTQKRGAQKAYVNRWNSYRN